MSLTITLRSFKRDPRYQRLAHEGTELVVTKRGRPYLRVLPPFNSGSLLGAAKGGKPLTSDFLRSVLPADEWEASR